MLLAVAAAFAIVLAVALGKRGPDLPGRRPVASAQAKEKAPQTAAPSIALARSLKPGARGSSVRRLQEGLAALGYETGVPDGIYGPSTSAAVAAFQREHGLISDGTLGPETTAAISRAVGTTLDAEAAPIERGLVAAAESGAIDRTDAARLGDALEDALAAAKRLPPARALALRVVLRDAAAHAADYTRPRALVLLGEIAANIGYLGRHPFPSERTDTRDADGIVYRFFPDHGFQFHPLASFAHLNMLVRQERGGDARRMADALVARAVPIGDALVWEYYFPVSGGPARWTSALAQAAGAGALASAGKLAAQPELNRSARAAYAAIPEGLSRRLGPGVWVREYSFSDIAILNAQLQSIVSLSRYAEITADREAEAFVARLMRAAAGLLPQFDTGCWSRYSLGGSPAPLAYHRYHVKLLEALARRSTAPVWKSAARRWGSYLETAGCAP